MGPPINTTTHTFIGVRLIIIMYIKTEEENIKLRSEIQELRSFKTRKDMLERVAKKDKRRC